MLTSINSRNQQGLRYLFDLNDTQSNPENIDMGAIQPVIDMNFCGYAKMNDYSNQKSCSNMAAAINGVQTKTYRILTYGSQSGLDPQIVVPVGNNFLLWGQKFHIIFDAAGAVAFNGKYITYQISMLCPDGTEIVKWVFTVECCTGITLYSPGASRVGSYCPLEIKVVPAACQLELKMWVQDGSNFPANTTANYKYFGTAYPIGAPIPSGI